MEYGNLSIRSVPNGLNMMKCDGGLEILPPIGAIVRRRIRLRMLLADDWPFDKDVDDMMTHWALLPPNGMLAVGL